MVFLSSIVGCGTCFSWNVSQKNLLVAIPSVGIPNIGLTTSINQAHGNTSIDFFFTQLWVVLRGTVKLINFVWQLVFQATRNLGYLHFTHPFVHCIFKLCSANWLSIVYRLLASPTKHVLFLIPQRFQVLPLPVGSYSECVCVCLYIHIYINIYILIIYTNMKNQGYICIFLC